MTRHGSMPQGEAAAWAALLQDDISSPLAKTQPSAVPGPATLSICSLAPQMPLK